MASNSADQHSFLDELKITPVINACGIYTDLGGSRLSARVWRAMEQMNRNFVRLPDLLDRTGEHIAQRLGAPAARIVPGAAAGIALGTAACIAGTDGAKSQMLPDTRGMKSKVIIQSGHRYKYDRQVSLAGGRLEEIGSENGTREDQLAQALDSETAMILHPAHLDSKPGTLPLERVAQIAAPRKVPVFVDAAYMNYPVSIMSDFIPRGANLVAFSAKYFGGPNAGGFLMGERDLVAAVTSVHFTRYESGQYLKFGRPLKMDRQTVAAVCVALDEWLEMDHQARFDRYARLVEKLRNSLMGLQGVKLHPCCFTMDERFVPEPVNCLLLTFDERSGRPTAAKVAAQLAAGKPSIAAIQDQNKLGFVMDVLEEDEVHAIEQAVKAAFA